MLDIRAIAEDPAGVAGRLATRGVDSKVVTDLAAFHGERKTAQTEADALRAEKKKVSKEIGALIKGGMSPEDAKAQVGAQTKEIDDKLAVLEQQIDGLEAKLAEHLMTIPNLPHESVPTGSDEADNVEVRKWGEPASYDFEVKDHVALSEGLGDILDFERGAKIAGARFTLLTGAAAKMQRALINFMLDTHTENHGYEEVWPPFLVNRQTATGTGNLPKFEADLFRIEDPELFLIPTAEVPVTNIHAGEILDGDDLPIKRCAYTPCFRREAGSYGKDTRGMIRQHQFEKVELVQFVKPEASLDALEELTGHAEVILQKLDLPYRVVTLCTGDMGFSATKTYDIEVWLPSQEKYREISSCSSFGDFQARRASIRFRREKKAKPELAHTLNGSGLAIGRTIVAILENHQQADGSIRVPDALRPYFGADTIAP